MKVTVTEKPEVTKLKAAKAAREVLKGKGSPTNKDLMDLIGQLVDLVGDIHEKVVK